MNIPLAPLSWLLVLFVVVFMAAPCNYFLWA
jgi:hypothetical protein